MHKMFLVAIIISLASKKSCHPHDVGNGGIDKIFRNHIDSGFSGTAIVVKADKVVLQKGYGYAKEENKISNTLKTLFNVASIGKPFTAVTVLKLEKQGLLNTKDYITKYVGKMAA